MLPDLETKCVPILIDDICSVWGNCKFKKLFNHSSPTKSPEFRIIMIRNVKLYNIYTLKGYQQECFSLCAQ